MSTFLKNNWFKFIAVAFLLYALADSPYIYYQFLRWAVMIIAGYTAYVAYNSQKIGWAWVFGIVAVLFNPIFPFYLSKDSWQFIDVVVAVLFLVSLSKTQKLEKDN